VEAHFPGTAAVDGHQFVVAGIDHDVAVAGIDSAAGIELAVGWLVDGMLEVDQNAAACPDVHLVVEATGFKIITLSCVI
jgi:hypothetical protein